MTSAVEGQIEFEHYHRYCVARDLCEGRDVLDVASGEGYGTAVLAGVARSATGIEIDPSAVDHAKTAYRSRNLRFLQGDALHLPLPEASADIVVSFETIEHVSDQTRFLEEVRRVLRPGGLFVVSTPDRTVYSAPGSEPNPYHVLELTEAELRSLLRLHFANATVLAQRPVLGSLLAADGAQSWRSYERRGSDVIEATNGLARPPYLVAVASDGALPVIPSSIYLDRRRVHDVVQDSLRIPDLTAERDSIRCASVLAEEALAAARVELRVAEMRAGELMLERDTARRGSVQAEAALAAARAELHASEVRSSELAHARDAARSKAAETAGLLDAAMQRADEAVRARDAVIYSTSWRLLAPLRSIGSGHPAAARTLRRCAKAAWWTVTLQLPARYVAWKRRRNASGQAASVPVAGLPTAGILRQSSDAEAPPGTECGPSSLDLRDAFMALHNRAPIHFPTVVDPEVSVVIPVYRGLEDLRSCLRSLALHYSTEPPFEVILVDDCPAEPVLPAVPDSGGLVKISSPQNQGFLIACNRGAAAARGRFICFLNSDTIVTPGWLRALIEALQEIPGAALSGGMLLNRDGTIQDAGWRILGDGWGYPIGRGKAPDDEAYTYRRPVDCVTGACFVMRRTEFEELGGFDCLYAPAYYEEFDLAFRARERGRAVIYEPRSRIVHLGGASYDDVLRTALSIANHDKFVDRFAEALRKQPWYTDDEFALRHAAGEGPVLLVVDYGVPRPDHHAGDVTISGVLSMLALAGWRVVFGAGRFPAERADAEALEQQGIEVIRTPEAIEEWIPKHGGHVREVLLCRPDIAERFLGPIRSCTEAHVTYYTHDLHYVRLGLKAQLSGDPADEDIAAQARRTEEEVFRSVDLVASPSEAEAETIRLLAPEAQTVIIPPYFYEREDVRAQDETHFVNLSDIVFVGGFPHLPNVDAALFIANDVMPLVWAQHPDARLMLVGYAPPPEVQELASDRVEVAGHVPEVDPFLARARVCLVALRYGAGVKGKTVDALRQGVPVVTTTIGAEGIGIEPGRHAIVAEDAQGLANAVVELLRDSKRCAELSAAGADLVRKQFSRVAARSALSRLFPTPRCGICGSGRLMTLPPESGLRDAFVCRNCFALGRSEVLARLVVTRLGSGGETSLAELARRRPKVSVHEFGSVGAVADTLRGQPWFTTSEYFDEVALGSDGPGGVRCEDLTNLTFADGQFDLVISQDVMEHVPDPASAFAEAARVLRPGGAHIFTVPQNSALRHSVTRARLGPEGVEHLLPPEYHGHPTRKEGALVYTDFGADVKEMLADIGIDLVVHDLPVLGGNAHQVVRVFEARKLAEGPPEHDNTTAREKPSYG